MPKRLVPATRWTRLAVAACVAAAALLGFQLWRSDPPMVVTTEQPPAAEQAGPPSAAGERAAEFGLQPSEDYAEIIERPLFSRSRRPAPPEDAKPTAGAPGSEEAAGRIAVNGILLTGNRRIALLRFDNDPKVMHVAEGQEAGGWLIEKISADRVVVRRGQQESEIVLDFKKSSDPQRAVPVPLDASNPDAAVADEEEPVD